MKASNPGQKPPRRGQLTLGDCYSLLLFLILIPFSLGFLGTVGREFYGRPGQVVGILVAVPAALLVALLVGHATAAVHWWMLIRFDDGRPSRYGASGLPIEEEAALIKQAALLSRREPPESSS